MAARHFSPQTISLFLFIAISCCTASAIAQGWTRQFDLCRGERYGNAIATADGGVVFAGIGFAGNEWYSDSLLLLLRVDAGGEEIWRKTDTMPHSLGVVLTEQLSDGNFAVFYAFKEDPPVRLHYQKRNPWGQIIAQQNDVAALQGPVYPSGRPFAIIRTETDDDILLSIGRNVLKMNGNGDMIWIAGLPTGNIATAAKKSAGNTYLIAGSGHDDRPFLSRWSATGQMLWHHLYQEARGAGDICSIIEIENGNILFSAEWIDAALNDGSILKTDATGELISIATTSNGTISDMVALPDAQGFVAVRNGFGAVIPRAKFLRFDLDMQPNFEHEMEGNHPPYLFLRKLIPAPDGGYYCLGSTNDIWSGEDFVFIKTDANGSVFSNRLKGSIRRDGNADCMAESGELPVFEGFKLQLTNATDTFVRFPRYDGSYAFDVSPGAYLFSAMPPPGSRVWQACPPLPVTFAVPNTLSEQDIAITPLADCPELHLQMSAANVLRICHTYYPSLTCTNRGSATAPSPQVRLVLPDSMEVLHSRPAISSQSGNVLIYNLNDLHPGEETNISLRLRSPCDVANLGREACFSASVATDTACLPPLLPGNIHNGWSNVNFCREFRGPYDPNDKSAWPEGVGEEHIIAPETRILYHIRFQNTGNDTAFLVVLRDTLSPQLDVRTLQPGASSHPYRLIVSDEGELQFRFENISLPDSSANFEESQGFVQFSIVPRQNAPLGTQIFNSAGIYFDFNPPIITNTVHHTLGRLSTAIQPVLPMQPEVTAAPNPALHEVLFSWKKHESQAFILDIWDASGRFVHRTEGHGDSFLWNRNRIPAGMYWYRLQLENAGMARGRLVLR
ncbi:MAG TPA: hypothetical protein PLL53_17470 [Saprospiraceae bacterium]|nr:hypothetical protein [Saprospiraceae bacterium]